MKRKRQNMNFVFNSFFNTRRREGKDEDKKKTNDGSGQKNHSNM